MSPPNDGASGGSQPPAAHRFDPTFTKHVIDTMGPNVTPRNREVLGALIRHIHDFSREVELSIGEWMAGVGFLNAVGAIYEASGRTRNESHRISDILGLESYVYPRWSSLFPSRDAVADSRGRAPLRPSRLVDEIAHKIVTEEGQDPTSSAILGPFWSPNAPFRENGSSIIQDPTPKGRPVLSKYTPGPSSSYPFRPGGNSAPESPPGAQTYIIISTLYNSPGGRGC